MTTFCFNFQTKENPIHYAARSGNAEIVEAIFSTDHVSLHVLQSVINSKTEVGMEGSILHL